jgi:hypothetical protein
MGETEYNTYSGWRAACKRAGADQFDGDRDICQALSNGTGVGEWDGVVGTVYDDAHKKSPKQVAKKSQNQGVAEGQLNEFGGGGFPKTPNYKVGDYVMVKGYQGVGKIAYIKHRADVGVIIKEPSPLRVQTTIDKLIPKQGVAEGEHFGGK